MYWHWLWWQIDVAWPKKRMLEEGIEGWYTCTYCASQRDCEYAFDLYSTNGDCLAEK